jgi:hypothetical protein
VLRGFGLFDEMLPGVPGEKAGDDKGHEAGEAAEDADQGLGSAELGDDLVLMALLNGVAVTEEELIFLVTGEGGVVGEQAQEAGQEDAPDDEQDGQISHCDSSFRTEMR